MFAKTPAPSYVAVIFTNQRTANDETAYALTAERMMELAAEQDGYLGVESVRGADGFGITVSYWRDTACIKAWKSVGEHMAAQKSGKNKWYSAFSSRIAIVERDSHFTS